MAGIQFQNLTGTRFPFVPYRGAGPAMLDLIAGRIDLIFDQVQNSLPLHPRTDRSKPSRSPPPSGVPALPDVPTVDEAGLPGLHISLWYGLWVPAGTPPEIVAKLNAAVMDAQADAATRQRLAELELQIPPPDQQTPQALHALQEAEIKKWWPHRAGRRAIKQVEADRQRRAPHRHTPEDGEWRRAQRRLRSKLWSGFAPSSHGLTRRSTRHAELAHAGS